MATSPVQRNIEGWATCFWDFFRRGDDAQFVNAKKVVLIGYAKKLHAHVTSVFSQHSESYHQRSLL